MPSFSLHLEQALHRALSLANEHQHEFATLEHLWMALTEDQDAISVMRACNVDIALLQKNLNQYLNEDLATFFSNFRQERTFFANSINNGTISCIFKKIKRNF